jgi:sugar (pentulose or hexulose) kinase
MSVPSGLRLAAVDLGATSGRVMVAEVGPDRLYLREVHRFPNRAVDEGGGLRWDLDALYGGMVDGLERVASGGPLHGIGIDSWGVDYALLDGDGRLLGNPYSHRDRRTDGVGEKVVAEIGAAELYAVNGLQQLPFNTVYQLVSALGTPELTAARTMLLIPDLLCYRLTGRVGAERTNASTTGLYDVGSRTWAADLAARIGIPTRLLPPIREPGSVVGPVLASSSATLEGVPVVAVGSHDTASAVVGVPAGREPFAYISSGTWSLVGLELDAPVLTDEARLADFTNETGVDGTIRFLRNVMGLWVLGECVREWGADVGTLLSAAAGAEPLRTVVDIDDPRLLPPRDMPNRLATLAQEAGEPVPDSEVAMTRCIVDSLALAYRRRVRSASRIAGRDVSVVHVVGGGTQNELLCRMTADACGLPVLAGPTEAAALGNVLVQARALGAALPDLAAMRALVRRTHDVRRYLPDLGLDWSAAEARLATRAG